MTNHTSYTYVASPYSSPNKFIMRYRYGAVARFTWALQMSGDQVYSPIAHWHHIARSWRMPTTFEFWEANNYVMLQSARRLLVLQLPGWRESKGVTAEIKFARDKNIPISHSWYNEDVIRQLQSGKKYNDFTEL